MSKQEDYFVKLNELVKLKFGDVEVGDFFFNKNKKGEIKATATIIKDKKSHDVEFKVFEDGSFNIISGDTELMDLATKILTEVLVPHIIRCAKEMNDVFNKIFEPIFGKKKEEEPEVVNDFALIYDSKNNKILFTDMNGSVYEFPRKESKVAEDISSVIESWKKDEIKDYEIDAEKLELTVGNF